MPLSPLFPKCASVPWGSETDTKLPWPLSPPPPTHPAQLPVATPQKKYNYKHKEYKEPQEHKPEYKAHGDEPKYDEPKYGKEEPSYKMHGDYNAPEYNQGQYPKVGSEAASYSMLSANGWPVLHAG